MKSKKSETQSIGLATLGAKGQIVIPVEIREMFDLHPGDQVFLMADVKKGIAIVKSDFVSNALDMGKSDD